LVQSTQTGGRASTRKSCTSYHMVRQSSLLVIWAWLIAASLTADAAEGTFTAFPDRSYAIEHVELIDGLGTPARRDWTVVVENGIISAVGPSATTTVAQGIRVIDGHGKSLMPGIVGMHEHLYYETNETMREAPTMLFSAPKLYLAAGVTTARTTGSFETYAELNLKRRIESGLEPGPDLDVTGPYLSGPNEPLLTQYASLSSPQDARETVDFWTSRGVTSFKAFLALTRDELKAVITEAHARGALVAGHLCSITMGEAADLGIDELEHGIVQSSDFVDGKVPDVCPPFRALFKSWASLQPDDPRVAALIQKLVAHRVAVTSTLAVLESGFGLAPPLSQRELSLLNDDAKHGYQEARSDPHQLPAKVARHILAVEMAFERAFVAQGGLLTEGADAGAGVIPGFADQREVELLVVAGFTPLQAIEITTANGARAMHRFDRIGSVERGKQADLLLLDGDATSDIATIEHPVLVIRNGTVYDPKKLVEATIGHVGRE
jgi:imidazolonepropionase-like amidohydrolase